MNLHQTLLPKPDSCLKTDPHESWLGLVWPPVFFTSTKVKKTLGPFRAHLFFHLNLNLDWLPDGQTHDMLPL